MIDNNLNVHFIQAVVLSLMMALMVVVEAGLSLFIRPQRAQTVALSHVCYLFTKNLNLNYRSLNR